MSLLTEMGQAGGMDLDDAADELYGLPLDEFIAARNGLVKQAKKEDVATAEQIRELRKPTVAAWLANQLARHRQPDLTKLLELGEELRTATAAMDGDRLRELTPRRHKSVNGLVQSARELTDKPVSQDVAQKLSETLDAAMVDPTAAAAIRSGRLTSALRHVGFGLVDESGEPSNVVSLAKARALREPARTEQAEPAEPAEPEPPRRRPTAAEQRRLKQAEKAVSDAQAEADRIDVQAEELAADLERRRDAVKAAQAEVERLAAELEDARDAVAEARSEVRRITDELEDARQDARAARRRTREAQIELARLEDAD